MNKVEKFIKKLELIFHTSEKDDFIIKADEIKDLYILLLELRWFKVMKDITLDKVKEAFWCTFHKSGEIWFNYLGTDEENQDCTESEWEDFKENLEKLLKKVNKKRNINEEGFKECH